MKRILFVLTVIAACGVLNAQTVYKVVAEDGSVTYTDQPVPGSQPVSLGRINTSEPLATVTPSKPKPEPKAAQPVTLSVYAPAPEATIRNNTGDVTITAATDRKVSGRFTLLLDGEAVGTNNTGVFSLTGVDRGAHQYQIQLSDNTGKILASSPTQTFYMHQASALINP